MKKLISVLLAVALVLSLVPFSAFALEVTSITYAPADENQYVFLEEYDGEWGTDYAGENYFWYHLNFYEGDILTVTYSDGSSQVFNAKYDYDGIAFYGESEVLRSWDDVSIRHDQEHEKWQPGGEYTFYVEYGGKQAPVTAKVVKNPVDSITYEPANGAITRYFEKGGYFDTDDNGEQYYYYNAYERNSGDRLTVYYNDDRGTVDYYLTYEPYSVYVSATDDNDIIEYERISMFSEQSRQPFTLGDNNFIYVEYMGKRAPVTVNIIDNPISELVYTPADDIVVTEYTNGEWVDEDGDVYFRYNTPWFKHGDQLAVTYTESGETVVYTYYTSYDGIPLNENTGFYDEEQNRMPEEGTLRTSHTGRWVIDGENYMSVYYMDNESNLVSVSIVQNPVKAIRFERESATVLTENIDVYYDDYDQRYYYSIPYHRDGDRLIITDLNGDEKVYEYSEFGYYTCEGEEDIPADEVHFRNDQHENPWGIGEHEYAVEYSGCEYVLTATVVENTVIRIEYIRKRAFNVFENTNGAYDNQVGYFHYWYPWVNDGDILIVYDSNTGRTEYELKIVDEENYYSAFISESGDIIIPENVRFEDDQYINHWTLGSDNYYYAVYMGARYPLVATIKENTVAAIRFEPVKTPEVMIGYQSHFDDELGYDVFELPGFNEGDKLIVIDKDGNEKTYIAELRYHSDIVFVDGEGDEIGEYDISRDSTQDNEPWHIGGGNEYYIEYMNAICPADCTVLDNPVVAIEYIPRSPIRFFERTGGWYDEWDDRYYYNTPGISNGDKLIVTYSDERGTVEYTSRYDQSEYGPVFVAENGDRIVPGEKFSYYSNQWENPWTVGTNYYTVTYCGVETQVPVLIRANNISGISYTPAAMPRVWLTDFEMVTDPETGVEYKRYNIPGYRDGDILTIYYNDETSEDFVLTFDETDGERYFISTTTGDRYHEYTLFFFDKQIEQPWAFGTGNYYYVEFYDNVASVEVELIETDIASIEYIPLNEIFINEFENGEFFLDDDIEFYFYHYESFINLGDKLTVTYKNGDVVTYVLDIDPLSEAWHLRDDEGGELDIDALNIDDKQWDVHWKPGVNSFGITYHGVKTSVDVTVNHKPGEVVYENVHTLTCTENGTRDEVVYCLACGEELSRNTVITEYAHGHNFVELLDEKYLEFEADFDSPAIYHKSCSVCGEASDDTFNYGDPLVPGGDYTGGEEPTDHTHDISTEWSSNSRYHWHTCSLCDWKFNKTAHTESSWIIDEEATDASAGHKHTECVVCGHIMKEEIIPAGAPGYAPGDINNDGDVNNKDLTRLFQYLSEWDVVVNELALDVNGDGDVNNKDLTRLFQYLSEWDVVIY